MNKSRFETFPGDPYVIIGQEWDDLKHAGHDYVGSIHPNVIPEKLVRAAKSMSGKEICDLNKYTDTISPAIENMPCPQEIRLFLSNIANEFSAATNSDYYRVTSNSRAPLTQYFDRHRSGTILNYHVDYLPVNTSRPAHISNDSYGLTVIFTGPGMHWLPNPEKLMGESPITLLSLKHEYGERAAPERSAVVKRNGFQSMFFGESGPQRDFMPHRSGVPKFYESRVGFTLDFISR